MELSERASGVLLHPTSLPSRHGIGDLGQAAYRFVDYLSLANQRYWQLLPLGPTGYGNSPYASTSAFAGNPLLIDLNAMAEENHCGELLADAPEFSSRVIDFAKVSAWKLPRLRKAAELFLDNAPPSRGQAFNRFCGKAHWWLNDYAMFVSIKHHADRLAIQSGAPNSAWNVFWDADLKRRCPEALARWSEEHEREIEAEKVLQFYFFEQWNRLKAYASDRHVRFIGDVPIFVALDSSDVWASPGQFLLDEELHPTKVAGVPPDYFSETGQRWGNPLYDWDAMRADGFRWWIQRFSATLELVDVVRLDHFRGFQACWSIAADEPTAINGHWDLAPGEDVFAAVRESLGEIPIIAEDLGVITPEVEALRDRHGFPGMRILQFAFDCNESRRTHFLPHHYIANTVVYTGTHDNDTVRGWYANHPESDRQLLHEYAGYSCGDVWWDLIRMALASVANTVIIPMQDVLGLGSEARLNQPATMGANWCWRLSEDSLTESTASRLSHLVNVYERNGWGPRVGEPKQREAEADPTQTPRPHFMPPLANTRSSS
ncbi:4-alpha-glucanotransferase [Planctomycetes bacterium CA13]|uniref:4-alpha-glucanotransferase n=1 Tax=Novipirellula herctigrandis TaxID=2527986 RepID=A0A5C5Z6Q6_9BACT|nr:4-alpha-glucanotransferase [Planctomycetes bacterium CA13]